MKHRLIYLSFLVAIAISVFSVALPHLASAAGRPPTSFKYTDKSWSNIIAQTTDGSQTYHKTSGSTTGYYNGGAAVGYDGCTAVIQTGDQKYDGDQNAQWWAACDDGVHDKKTVQISGGDTGVGIGSTVNTDQRQVFDYELCPALKSLDQTLYSQTCNVDFAKQSDQDNAVKKMCNQYASQLQKQCSDYTNKTYNPDNAPAANDNQITDQCDLDPNPLTWIICPVVFGMTKAINVLDDTINSLLSVGSPGNTTAASQIFCDDATGGAATAGTACDQYHQAWASFRDIALGLLVIVALVVVISQAIGVELLDAYTVRKVLPRMVLAAITITLSWQLMQFFVDMSNALGYGIRFLIYAPFTGDANINKAILGGGSQAVADIIVVSSVVVFTLFGLLSYAVTGLIAVFIAYIVLILRQIAVIILIIIAPIAIVASILPNTRNAYKLWWDSFAKALMMFPIIAALIAAGRVFAAVADTNGSNVFGQILGFAAYFAPYFLIPLTFRFAGGALRGIGGFVNDRGRGGFDGLRNFRKARASQSMQAIQENRRFNPNRRGVIGRINRGANLGLSNLSSPDAAAKIYGGTALSKLGIKNSMGSGIINSINQEKLAHSQKLGEKLNQLGFNDRALKSLMNMDDFSAGAIRTKAQELKGSDNSNDRLAGTQLETNAAFLAQNLYKDPEMGRADIGMAAGLAVTAQGFGDTNDIANLANKRRFGGTESGLASAFVTQAQLNGQRAGRMDMKAGYGIQIGDEGEFMAMGAKMKDGGLVEPHDSEANERIAGHQVKRIMTMGRQDLETAKAPSVTALQPGFRKILTAQIDPNTGQSAPLFQYKNEKGEMEDFTVTKDDVKRVATMMGQSVSSFSGTSPDTTRAIQALRDAPGVSSEAIGAFDAASRADAATAARINQEGAAAAEEESH